MALAEQAAYQPDSSPVISNARRTIIGRLGPQQTEIERVFEERIQAFLDRVRAETTTTGVSFDTYLNLKDRAFETATAAHADQIDLFRRNIRSAVSTELVAQVENLRTKGVTELATGSIDELQSNAVSEALYTPFPNTQYTTEQRVQNLAQKTYSLLVSILDEVLAAGEFREESGAVGDLMRAHTFRLATRVGNGRAVASSIARISRTEQSRATHNASREFARRSGITLAYWRLSPRHPWRGGEEICERYAVSTGADINDELDRLDGPRSLSTDGLYTITSAPTPPHPNCMCGLELTTAR